VIPADSVLAIPFGVAFAVGGLLLLVDPERFLGIRGWPRTLERFLGRRAAVAILRISGGFLAAVTTWFVVHEATALLS
jgi:hypothetical protein